MNIFGKKSKTITFTPVGAQYQCQFPSSVFSMRKDVILHSIAGDKVFIKPYKYNNETALAVMSFLGADIGVVPREINAELKGYKKGEGVLIKNRSVFDKEKFYPIIEVTITFS